MLWHWLFAELLKHYFLPNILASPLRCFHLHFSDFLHLHADLISRNSIVVTIPNFVFDKKEKYCDPLYNGNI